MTEIVLAHDQKLIRGHYFPVEPNASPKLTPVLTKHLHVFYFLLWWRYNQTPEHVQGMSDGQEPKIMAVSKYV